MHTFDKGSGKNEHRKEHYCACYKHGHVIL